IPALLALAGCDRSPTRSEGSSNPGSSPLDKVPSQFKPEHLFTEITGELGFDPSPPPYPDGTFMTPEITPGGVAVFDYDNDGLLDILVVRHPVPSPWEQQLKASEPNRLYKQQPDHTFKEVRNAAGL